MEKEINVKLTTLLQMDPINLAFFLDNETELNAIKNFKLDDNSDMQKITDVLNKATSYIVYFREMETLTKIYKRQRKREGCDAALADNLLGCEEVFATFKKQAEQVYDQVTKLMTAKRLNHDEEKMLGKVT